MTDARWLAQAIDLAVANVADGGGPFGTVIVRPTADGGELVATGVNRVTTDLDPSAHGEVTAIRAACRAVDDFSLAGFTLYTSCEPCPMCLTTSLWARIDRIVYAANREDAAAAGFDDRAFYELLGDPRLDLVQELRPANATAPFEAWAAKSDRVDY